MRISDWSSDVCSSDLNKVPERLVVPYAAITAFADPSVQFGLQFRVAPNPEFRPVPAVTEAAGDGAATPADEAAADQADGAERTTGEVVGLGRAAWRDRVWQHG